MPLDWSAQSMPHSFFILMGNYCDKYISHLGLPLFNLSFRTYSYANSFYVTISSDQIADARQCIQVGGYNIINCDFSFKWPSTFNYYTAGTYSAVVDISSAASTVFDGIGEGTYDVCKRALFFYFYLFKFL